MSTKQRGTKRGAESSFSGPKQKFAKSAPSKNFKSQPKSFKKDSFKKEPFKGKGKAPAKQDVEPPVQKRKKRITEGGGEEDAKDDDDMSVDGDEFDMDEMDVDAPEGAENGEDKPEKKRMTKEERAALHAAQPHRTTLLPSHALLTNTLLPLWEQARRSEVPKEERKKMIDELWTATKGHCLEISRGHKGGRILQTIVKYGGKEERTGVAMELEPQWRAMLESKYSKFLMAKLIRYCPSIRPLLVPQIAKNMSALLFHAEAIQPISDFYDLYASAKERRGLVRGFYPREVALFDGGKDGDTAGLEDALESTGEAGRARVLEAIEKTVLDVFNATQKSALAQSVFHRLVAEYLACIYRFLTAEEADKKMHELLAAALESLPEIVHTKDGSGVVRELLVRGNAKDRKSILQHLRKHNEALCKDADAQLVLFTAFDVVDDTKLMAKAFVADVITLAPGLLEDKNGRRAVLYLLTPRASRHYLHHALQSLEASAQMARDLGTSKKDPAVRRKELLTAASPGLLELVADKGETLVRDPASGLVVTEIMLSTTGDKTAAIAAITAPLSAPMSGDGEHVLELAHATRTYKTLLSGGHFNAATKSVDVVDTAMRAAFATAFWDAISSDDAGGKANVAKLAAAAPFVVLEMLEALRGGERWDAAKAVLGSEDVVDEVKGSEMKGAGALAERLAEL